MKYRIMICLAGLAFGATASGAGIVLTRIPDGGLQPQVLAGPDGTTHLVYFSGNPAAGNLFYARKAAGENTFSEAMRVNSEPGAAIALGTIRGAQIALGKAGRVHVAWNGSGKAAGHPGAPMLYTRLDNRHLAFEPERDVMTFSSGLDGGGSIAADQDGNVYVAWHGRASDAAQTEADRSVFLAISTNGGRTFAPEQKVNPDPTGACACCGMKAFADRERNLYLLYRAARRGTERDEVLVVSKDFGRTFRTIYFDPWKSTTCPMSSAWLAPAQGHRTIAAWETRGQVWFTTIPTLSSSFGMASQQLGDGSRRPASSSQPGGEIHNPITPGGTGQKHPAAVANAQGETLVVWAEGTGWQKGGAVAWRLFDDQDKPKGVGGRKAGIPAWSFPAAVARPDGSFEIFY